MIQQMKPKSEKIERIVRDVYPNPEVPDTNVGTKLGTDLAELGTDCISRQSAIDAFNTNINELVVGGEENAKTVENYLNRVLDKIKCLPSAQPEPKRGKWIYQNGMVKCDQCLRAIRRIDHDGLLNFCPNCGADMRGKKK